MEVLVERYKRRKIVSNSSSPKLFYLHQIPKTCGKVDIDKLSTAIQNKCSMTKGDVKYVIEALVEEMQTNLANGNKVKLNQLGAFHMTFRCGPLCKNKNKENMRTINLIVIHCSATRCDRCYTEHDLAADHLRRGFSEAGYHFYIRKNGDIKSLRPVEKPGAHARGHNANSIGICYEGGLDEHGRPCDTRTPWQKHSLRVLVMLLLRDYPGSRLCGHRDLSPNLNHNGEIEPEEWVKQCPCFNVVEILSGTVPENPAYL